LATHLGKAIAKDKVSEAISDLVDVYRQERTENERFVDTYKRIGVEPFKQRVYQEEQ
jgi:sulfite reductase (NADPH) hemoprotein beta-component